MLDKLFEVEKLLPKLLSESAHWQSLFIDYEVPRVERVWVQWGEYRVCLHRIHPCKKPFKHKHLWPAAMRIDKGEYKMEVGYSKTSKLVGTSATIILTPGSCYEMLDKDAWHSVNPLGGPTMSHMVIGQPRSKRNGKKLKLSQLPPKKVEYILNYYRKKYR